MRTFGGDTSGERAGDGRHRRPALLGAGALVLWLAAWQLASVAVGSKILLPGPLDTLVRLGEVLFDGRFLALVGFSTARIVGGFLAAYALALVLAFVACRLPQVGSLLAPALQALKSVPIACVIVLLLIWVGSRQVSAIAVFVAVFPAVYFSCAEGLAQVDAKVSEMLVAFGVRGSVRLFAHVWPQVLPYLVGTARNVCGMAWKAGIAAELIGSPLGSVGERIYQAKILLETADLFAWTIVVVALSAVCERVFVTLLQRSDRLAHTLGLALAQRRVPEQGAGMVPSSIVLSDAVLGYGGTAVARGVSLNLGPGSCTVLADASGAGKTTLLRTVAGLQPLLRGGALLLPPAVSVMFQEARLIEGASAVDNVVLAAGGRGVTRQEARAQLAELLDEGALDVPVTELSGGQRRRVELVRALACPSTAVLLDEPFASLDAQAHWAAADYVRRHLAGRTLLVASHVAGDAALLEADELSLFS